MMATKPKRVVLYSTNSAVLCVPSCGARKLTGHCVWYLNTSACLHVSVTTVVHAPARSTLGQVWIIVQVRMHQVMIRNDELVLSREAGR